MNKFLLACGVVSLLGGFQAAQAATATYNVTTTWYEPETRPDDSIFVGTFQYDNATHVVSNLQGILSESMTGTNGQAYPNDDMTWIALTYSGFAGTQWYDASLQGTLVAVFAKNSTATFVGDTWTPQDGVDSTGTFAGYRSSRTARADYAASIQNSYALIFVPDTLNTSNTTSNPLVLTWNENTGAGSRGLAYTAYADCAPGGMMGSTCMTATSARIYGYIGTMSGIPLSQTITLASVPPPVPEPETYATLIAGLGLMGVVARRRRRS